MEVLGLDTEGFALKPLSASLEQTVPPHAKVRAEVRLASAPEKVAKLRVWSEELAVR